jgi:UPF0271 protein
MAVDPEDLADEILYQIAALDGFARLAGTRVGYVKPHGALYNTVANDPVQADALAEAVHRYEPGLALLGLAGSQGLYKAAQKGLGTVAEAFVDRAYTSEGTLLPRGQPGAVLHDLGEIVERCVDMVLTGKVRAIDGTVVAVRPRSLCVHGDTPGAVRIARAVREELLAAGVRVVPFTAGKVPCAS